MPIPLLAVFPCAFWCSSPCSPWTWSCRSNNQPAKALTKKSGFRKARVSAQMQAGFGLAEATVSQQKPLRKNQDSEKRASARRCRLGLALRKPQSASKNPYEKIRIPKSARQRAARRCSWAHSHASTAHPQASPPHSHVRTGFAKSLRNIDSLSANTVVLTFH